MQQAVQECNLINHLHAGQRKFAFPVTGYVLKVKRPTEKKRIVISKAIKQIRHLMRFKPQSFRKPHSNLV
jgi:hypothetical protein